MKKQYLHKLFLITMVMFFCLQIFRVFLASVLWYFFNALGNPAAVAGIALGVFLAGLFVSPLCRFFGRKQFFTITVSLIIFVRLLLQCIQNPLAVALLSLFGMIIMEWFLVVWVTSHENISRDSQPQVFTIALPAAILGDSIIRMLFSGYDLVWHKHALDIIVIVFLCIAMLGALKLVRAQFSKDDEAAAGGSFLYSLPLFAFGSWLYVQMALLQNIAALSGLSGSNDARLNMIVTIANSAGLILCAGFQFMGGTARRIATGISGSILAASVVLLMRGAAHAEWFIIAVNITAWIITGALFSVQAPKKKLGLFSQSFILFAGLLVMLVLIFLHADRKIFEVTAAAACICALTACTGMFASVHKKTNYTKTFLFCIAAATLIMAVSIILSAGAARADFSAPNKNGIKLLTYNIHMGFDADLVMNVERIAETIESLNPDIVGLQEVNRAQAANGMTDTMMYLAKRLKYQYYCYGGNHHDKQFGNAVFSRYPIIRWTNNSFKINGSDPRGFLHAVINVNGQLVNVYVTHLDYAEGKNNQRVPQVKQIVAGWNNKPHSIIMGDLNAAPYTPELSFLYSEKRLFDVLASVDKKFQNTFYAGWGDPALKLDYIFATTDINVIEAGITETRTSDHKPVCAVIMTK